MQSYKVGEGKEGREQIGEKWAIVGDSAGSCEILQTVKCIIKYVMLSSMKSIVHLRVWDIQRLVC